MPKQRDASVGTVPNALVDYLVSVNPLARRSHVEAALLESLGPVAEPSAEKAAEALAADKRCLLALAGDMNAWVEDQGDGVLSVSTARPNPGRAWEGMSPTRH